MKLNYLLATAIGLGVVAAEPIPIRRPLAVREQDCNETETTSPSKGYGFWRGYGVPLSTSSTEAVGNEWSPVHPTVSPSAAASAAASSLVGATSSSLHNSSVTVAPSETTGVDIHPISTSSVALDTSSGFASSSSAAEANSTVISPVSPSTSSLLASTSEAAPESSGVTASLILPSSSPSSESGSKATRSRRRTRRASSTPIVAPSITSDLPVVSFSSDSLDSTITLSFTTAFGSTPTPSNSSHLPSQSSVPAPLSSGNTSTIGSPDFGSSGSPSPLPSSIVPSYPYPYHVYRPVGSSSANLSHSAEQSSSTPSISASAVFPISSGLESSTAVSTISSTVLVGNSSTVVVITVPITKTITHSVIRSRSTSASISVLESNSTVFSPITNSRPLSSDSSPTPPASASDEVATPCTEEATTSTPLSTPESTTLPALSLSLSAVESSSSLAVVPAVSSAIPSESLGTEFSPIFGSSSKVSSAPSHVVTPPSYGQISRHPFPPNSTVTPLDGTTVFSPALHSESSIPISSETSEGLSSAPFSLVPLSSSTTSELTVSIPSEIPTPTPLHTPSAVFNASATFSTIFVPSGRPPVYPPGQHAYSHYHPNDTTSTEVSPVFGSHSSSVAGPTAASPYPTPSVHPTTSGEIDDDEIPPALKAWLEGLEFFRESRKGSKGPKE